MATLAFDGPGQGEAEYDLPIRGDFEVPVKAVFDFLEARSDLDAKRAGIWGVSLGGYYAARAAAFEKRAKACISLSGPYSWVETFDARNELSREAFRVRSHSKSMETAREVAKTLTLEGVARNITCPIFVVGGELDNLTPPHNAKRIAAEVAGPCELLIVKGGNHVANNRRYMFQTQTADWMGIPHGPHTYRSSRVSIRGRRIGCGSRCELSQPPGAPDYRLAGQHLGHRRAFCRAETRGALGPAGRRR
jgi:2,6-dihydroxypseudooxynicotine hydrolase